MTPAEPPAPTPPAADLDIFGDPGVLIVDKRFVELVRGVEEGVRPLVLPDAAESGSDADTAEVMTLSTYVESRVVGMQCGK